MLRAEDIRRLLPHAGSMCLIERVVAHDDAHIVCTSSSHCDNDNPLRSADALAALHAIEYGAQAMAVHGRLTGNTGGVCALVAAREVEMRIDWLSDIFEPLQITATVIMKNNRAATYRFSVQADNRLLVSGRLTVGFFGSASA